MCGVFLGEITRKARKQHWCAACCIPIPKGFAYTITADTEDGRAQSTKWHTECWTEFRRMLKEDGSDCGAADWTWENGMPKEVRLKYEPTYTDETEDE